MLVQKANEENARPTYAEKLLSQWEKVGLCILRVKLEYMKDVLSHEMKCYLQCRRRFNVLELVCRAKLVRASMHKNH